LPRRGDVGDIFRGGYFSIERYRATFILRNHRSAWTTSFTPPRISETVGIVLRMRAKRGHLKVAAVDGLALVSSPYICVLDRRAVVHNRMVVQRTFWWRLSFTVRLFLFMLTTVSLLLAACLHRRGWNITRRTGGWRLLTRRYAEISAF
jgi:hypothetical protein